jgi:hypothetical protein
MAGVMHNTNDLCSVCVAYENAVSQSKRNEGVYNVVTANFSV